MINPTTSSHADYVGGDNDNDSSDDNANDSSEVTKIENEQDILESELASVNDGNNNESIVCAREVKSIDLVMPSEPSSVPCMQLFCELVTESIKTEVVESEESSKENVKSMEKVKVKSTINDEQ